MPTFRCPKCRAPLTVTGAKTTTHCGSCGQFCALPVAPAAPKPAAIKPAAPPPPAPLAAAPPYKTPKLTLDDVVDDEEIIDVGPEPADDVLDVVPHEEIIDLAPEPADNDVMDVVAAGAPRRRSEEDRAPRKKKGRKSANAGYRKPIWLDDDDNRGSGWLSPALIVTGLLLLFGFILLFLSVSDPSYFKLLFAYGILLTLVAIIWGIYVAGTDGEGARSIFWLNRWIYLVNNLDRGIYPLILEVVGAIFLFIGMAGRG